MDSWQLQLLNMQSWPGLPNSLVERRGTLVLGLLTAAMPWASSPVPSLLLLNRTPRLLKASQCFSNVLPDTCLQRADACGHQHVAGQRSRLRDAAASSPEQAGQHPLGQCKLLPELPILVPCDECTITPSAGGCMG